MLPVGRAPGTQAKYIAVPPGYDSAMHDFETAAGHTAWTYDLLYQFLKAPGQFMPGTKMTFVGLPSSQDRINVIAYLRSNGSPSYAIPAPKPAAAPSSGAPNPAGAGPATAPAPGAAKTAATPTTVGTGKPTASEPAHAAPPG